MAEHILIVEAPYYQDVSDFLAKGTIEALDKAGAKYEHVTVPGALEIPAAIKFAHLSKKYDGYIALGCVIRGETSHYDIVCENSAGALTQLSVDLNLAIGNAILTCENKEQALERANPAQKNKGRDAAAAVLSLIELKEKYGVK